MRQNWQLFSKNMSDDLVDNIINLAGETQKASTFNGGDDSIRSSRVCWMTQHEWLKDLLFNYCDWANQNAFHFNIYKKADIQYTEYHGDEKGHYGLHHDIDWNRSDGLDRKISITVQLSDPSEYEGGSFEFTEIQSPDVTESKAKGTVLVFPSYLQHKVNPVTKGTRRSLVAWFEGPTFR
jgi:PKHD-type hydroxylase